MRRKYVAEPRVCFGIHAVDDRGRAGADVAASPSSAASLVAITGTAPSTTFLRRREKDDGTAARFVVL